MSTQAPLVAVASFGPLVIGTDIDDALLATLQKWMPTYLRRYHNERNLGFTPARPRTYANTFEGHEFLDHQLPAIVCMTAQLTATLGGPNVPLQGAWQSQVAVIVRGKRPAATRYLAAMYGGTVARVVLQQGRAEPLDSVHLTSARYEEVPDVTGQSRWLLAAVHQFAVQTDEMVQPWAATDVPDADEYVDEATVVEVDLDVLGSQTVIGGI